MAGRKPRSEWSDAYRARIEAAERLHPGASHWQLRGAHPKERTGDLGFRKADQLAADLRSASQEPRVVVEGDRVVVTTIDETGAERTTVMSRDQWNRLRPKGRPRKGVTRPKIWQYRKRHRKAA